MLRQPREHLYFAFSGISVKFSFRNFDEIMNEDDKQIICMGCPYLYCLQEEFQTFKMNSVVFLSPVKFIFQRFYEILNLLDPEKQLSLFGQTFHLEK